MKGFQSIKDARTELGLTQDDLADQLGITRQTYAKMESDPGNLTINEARTICAVLGKRCEDIFFATIVK